MGDLAVGSLVLVWSQTRQRHVAVMYLGFEDCLHAHRVFDASPCPIRYAPFVSKVIQAPGDD